MKGWPLARLPLGNETGRTFDEKPHMYFFFQSFGIILNFPQTFTPFWCFRCTAKVELCFQCVPRMPAGFLGNLKQMDKWCDLYYHPLENLGLIFHNGPGIWGGFLVTWLLWLLWGRSKTSKQPKPVKWLVIVLGSSTVICSRKPSLTSFSKNCTQHSFSGAVEKLIDILVLFHPRLQATLSVDDFIWIPFV